MTDRRTQSLQNEGLMAMRSQRFSSACDGRPPGSFAILVNITSIIRLSRNSQEKGPVEIPRGLPWIWAIPTSTQSSNPPILPMRESILGFPVQVFEGRFRDDALDRPVGGVTFQLHRAVMDGHEEGKGRIGPEAQIREWDGRFNNLGSGDHGTCASQRRPRAVSSLVLELGLRYAVGSL